MKITELKRWRKDNIARYRELDSPVHIWLKELQTVKEELICLPAENDGLIGSCSNRNQNLQIAYFYLPLQINSVSYDYIIKEY